MSWYINGTLFTGTIITVGSGKDYENIRLAVEEAPNNSLLLVDPGSWNTEGDSFLNINKLIYIRGLGASPEDTILRVGYWGILSRSGGHGYYENLTIRIEDDWQRAFSASTGGIVTANKVRVLPANVYTYSAGYVNIPQDGTFNFKNCYLTKGHRTFVYCNLSLISLDKVEFDVTPDSWNCSGSLSGDYVITPTEGYGYNYGELTITNILIPSVPTVITNNATSITDTSFTANGEASSSTTPTTSRGFVYKIGSGQTPTLEDYDDIFTESGGDGLFSHSFTGLTSGTTYSVRAFAINTEGTGLGDVVEVVTSSASITVTTLACDPFASSIRANATISPSTYAIDTVGFLYYNVSNPDPLRIAQRTGDYTGAFSFSEVISAGIGPNGSYMVKAFVKYNDVTYYGEWVLVSTIVISEIEVTPILPELQIGETVQLTVTATYTDGSTADLTSFAGYSSQDLVTFTPVYGEENTFIIDYSTRDTIATVSSGGLITDISGGIAKIYIYVSGFKDTASLTVVQPAEGTVDVGGIWDGG